MRLARDHWKAEWFKAEREWASIKRDLDEMLVLVRARPLPPLATIEAAVLEAIEAGSIRFDDGSLPLCTLDAQAAVRRVFEKLR